MSDRDVLTHFEGEYADAYESGREAGRAEGYKAGRADERARIRRPKPNPITSRDDYEKGYRAGYATGRNRAHADMGEDPPPRQRKYAFPDLAIDGSFTTPEKNHHKVYVAGRMWAKRNAPSRRFRCRPDNATGGTIVIRWR